MTNFTYKIILLVSALVCSQSAFAGDELEMGEVIPVNLLSFPTRGMSTGKVENELGRPNEIIAAIGTPPISRWVYNDRTVYFEYSSVIHVVAK